MRPGCRLWDLPPRDLAVLLYQMIETGDRGRRLLRRHHARRHQPGRHRARPARPRSAAAFLDRLDAALAGGRLGRRHRTPPKLARIRAAARTSATSSSATPPCSAGSARALDGPGTLDEADAWYFILEGTREPSVAEAQAHGADRAGRPRRHQPGTRAARAILLAADDYSAVSRRVPLSNLYERGRSLGLGVQVSAQSWQGLGADEDERYRIAATADGGIWVMHTPYPEPLVAAGRHPPGAGNRAQAHRQRLGR